MDPELMANFKHYIQAARLRTLPLSVSGIIVGSAMATPLFYETSIFWLAILTTIGFQVLSNFANDYGDGIKGTDDNRVGEKRLVASGVITPKQMKRAMIIMIIMTLLIALALIYRAFGENNFVQSVVFLILGISSIVAAIKYTVGKSAYGYSGLGDIFVFLFFGLLSTLGSYYLYTHALNNWKIILPAAAIGLLSAAVLNLNNMRDQIADKKANKNTLVVKLGSQWAKLYHFGLINIALILLIWFTNINGSTSPFKWLFIIAFFPLLHNLRVVGSNILFRELDGELKKVALSTFLCAILLAVSFSIVS